MLRTLARDIIRSQEQEIRLMQAWLEKRKADFFAQSAH
jgi:uncharacterized protein (DUF305 family)